ncbi:MAG: hypothetical protein JO324_00820 [Candidatus Eremiobacteraeota bacterium]|nr:hypothetical protein [Candidatus Eremiobacteraeota bacterium]
MLTPALILVVFAVFAVLMYLRAMPALVAVPCMALAMSLAAGVPVAHLGSIVTGGAVQLAPVYVAVVCGALLGRVTIETGIARTIVNVAAEYGGEQPLVLALGLCAIVALLFTSLSGLGGIIMVGTIVLPIMMTSGVPRTVAAPLFLMAFALGYIFNIANWTFYTKYFGIVPQQLTRYAIALAAIDAVALVLFALVAFRRERGYATWAMKSPRSDAAQRVPVIALVTPVLPLLLYYALRMDATPAFLIAAIFGAVVARPSRAVTQLVAAAIKGLEDVAPAVLLFMGIGMLLVATKEPQFAAALQPLVAGGWLRNPIAYVLLFGVASPLVLYRGPLNPFGVGIAVFTVLLGANVLPAVIIVAAIMAVVQVQNVCDPTNTANVWIANFTGVPIDAITKRTLPYQVAVAVVACVIVVLAPSLFSQRAFAAALPRALAAQAPSATYAPAAARSILAVDDDATALGRSAADRVSIELRSAGWHAIRLHDDPNARDCGQKRYAAHLLVLASTFHLREGEDVDVALRLSDCGGWIVNEWHDHEVVSPPPRDADAAALAAQGVQRLLEWASAEAVRSRNLLLLGVAAQAGDPPTYFYAFFKTPDGELRAYVRAGGPAYAAGLRSGDVVQTIDGMEWWRLGTYQSQQLAYDGRPHVFGIQRDGHESEVRLGAPFSL